GDRAGGGTRRGRGDHAHAWITRGGPHRDRLEGARRRGAICAGQLIAAWPTAVAPVDQHEGAREGQSGRDRDHRCPEHPTVPPATRRPGGRRYDRVGPPTILDPVGQDEPKMAGRVQGRLGRPGSGKSDRQVAHGERAGEEDAAVVGWEIAAVIPEIEEHDQRTMVLATDLLTGSASVLRWDVDD